MADWRALIAKTLAGEPVGGLSGSPHDLYKTAR